MKISRPKAETLRLAAELLTSAKMCLLYPDNISVILDPWRVSDDSFDLALLLAKETFGNPKIPVPYPHGEQACLLFLFIREMLLTGDL